MGDTTHTYTTFHGDAAVEKIREVLAGITPGRWEWAATEEMTIEEMVEDLRRQLEAGKPGELWGVTVPSPTEPGAHLTVASTGNGPNSRANALFLACAPDIVRFLLSELDEAKRKLENVHSARWAFPSGRHA